ncbi:MAG: YjgN family protein [Betaproteobacteria bacterium]|nr:YjgN family protein [Betaproteobacteria bacterium]
MQDSLPELPDSVLLLAESTHLPFEQPPFRGSPATVSEHRLQFVGSGGEYFRIWFVNLFLSILSLGIYSAWAKVRREQYFHRNTLLDGSGFDYHGNPKAILKGRIIAVGLLAILSVIDRLAPAYHFPALLLASPLFPWLLIRSFIFRARNTSFRGLHFDFLGTYKGLCKAFLGYILVFIALGWVMNHYLEQAGQKMIEETKTEQMIEQAADDVDDAEEEEWKEECGEADADADACEASEETLEIYKKIEELKEELERERQKERESQMMRESQKALAAVMPVLGLGFLGMLLLVPAIMGTLKRFQLNNLAFGSSGFHARLRLSSFYVAYLRASLPILIIAFVMGVVVALAVAATGLSSGDMKTNVPVMAMVSGVMILSFLFYLVILLIAPAYLGALIANLIWNNTSLEKHGFVSDQTFWGITGITLSNWLLILLTAGFYWPWARVRLAAYRARHTAVLASGDLDNFIAGAKSEKSAIGEEIADIFDFDIAL